MLGTRSDSSRYRKSLLESFFLLLRFKRGFESEPTLHSGINYAVLLLAAGHQFDTSFELRKVGESVPLNLLDVEKVSVQRHPYASAPSSVISVLLFSRSEAEQSVGQERQPGQAAELLGRGLLLGRQHLGQ